MILIEFQSDGGFIKLEAFRSIEQTNPGKFPVFSINGTGVPQKVWEKALTEIRAGQTHVIVSILG